MANNLKGDKPHSPTPLSVVAEQGAEQPSGKVQGLFLYDEKPGSKGETGFLRHQGK